MSSIENYKTFLDEREARAFASKKISQGRVVRLEKVGEAWRVYYNQP